jgi:ppGpp synthetase/RelA/SpoT-type nucleotidyltranferase
MPAEFLELEFNQLEESLVGDMPWTRPLNGASRVDLAGDAISGRRILVSGMQLDTAMDIAANWRSSHGYPLSIMTQSLERRAKKFNRRALVAQRLKRMPSIQAKLSRFPTMQLSKMHDLGGCRAILGSVKNVYDLARFYESHPYRAAEFVKPYDYIKKPKPDGYRGIHLVYKYQGEHQGGAYKGLRIEIQLRSRRQHAWAAAVETIDSFTGQALKSNIGNESWKRFFVLMATAIAVLEKQPPVPNSPPTSDELVSELRSLGGCLKVPDVFYGIEAGMKMAPTFKRRSGIYILTLDSEKKVTSAIGFDTSKEAEEHYLEMEKENKDKPHIQTVMVSLASMRNLRAAYPSYFLDTKEFIILTEAFCGNAKKWREHAR